MMESDVLATLAEPYGASGLEQLVGSEHVGFDELIRCVDGAIYVRLRREVHHCGDGVLSHELLGQPGRTDVTVDEGELRIVVRGIETRRVSSIGERVQHDHPIEWVPTRPEVYEVGSDEA